MLHSRVHIIWPWWSKGCSSDGKNETVFQSISFFLSQRSFYSLAVFGLNPTEIFTSFLRSVSLWPQVSQGLLYHVSTDGLQKVRCLIEKKQWLSPSIPPPPRPITEQPHPVAIVQAGGFRFPNNRRICALGEVTLALAHRWASAKFPFCHCQHLQMPSTNPVIH